MKLLEVNLQNLSKENILEKVDFWLKNPVEMRNIVSINPELLITAKHDNDFRFILQSGDVRLNDGIGVIFAAKWLSNQQLQRYTGVDFMNDLLTHIQNRRLRVLFLGGKGNLAEKLAKRYSGPGSNLVCKGILGVKDITMYQEGAEGAAIMKEIDSFQPQIIFAAYGSPFQEKWFWNHREQLKGIICCGVGGGFDFLGGEVKRAPAWVRSLGLEWFFRLLIQPWRWKRQLRLLEFMWLVLSRQA